MILPVDGRITVLLGANDHGKSNVLEAILHLNSQTSYEADDLNWDSAGSEPKYPSIKWRLTLSDDDRQQLADAENEARAATAEPSTDTEGDGTEEPPATPEAPKVDWATLPTEVTYNRVGLSGSLTFSYPQDDIDTDVARKVLGQIKPRVELFEPISAIPDSVTADTVDDGDQEFMRGIFFFAGLESEEWPSIFEQTDATRRRLQDATRELNKTIRRAWSQGKELEFFLDHQQIAGAAAIALRINDPAVHKQVVRASRRSSGFTHFFALRTILHARQRGLETRHNIWLFDEPGIYLHPAGQHDLLQALETLADRDQLIYSTHSVFLINKNYPVRHRLMKKDELGTGLDSKPYAGQWHSAIEALGLALPGTILFAPYVLLVEGDSDAIYLYGLLQILLEAGVIDMDLNQLAIVPTGSAKHADALIRILLDSNAPPKIAVLVDGDQGGRDRLKYLKKLLDDRGVATIKLDTGAVIEDFLPDDPKIYVRAVANFLTKLDASRDSDGWYEAIVTELGGDTAFESRKSFGNSVLEAARTVATLPSAPSKLGISREYTIALATSEKRKPRVKSTNLAKRIATALALPSVRAPEDVVRES